MEEMQDIKDLDERTRTKALHQKLTIQPRGIIWQKNGYPLHRPRNKFQIQQKKRMKPQSVKYVIVAQDMDRAVAFYRDTLGFTENFASSYWSELSFGDAIIGLHGGGDGSRQKTGLSIQYEDIESAFSRALANGGTSITAPERREGEPIILSTILDPEGNEIMITQYVGDE